MNICMGSVVPVCLLLIQATTALSGNITVIDGVISYTSLFNGSDVSQNIILNGADYLDAFYYKLCDKDTYYYTLSFEENGFYYALKTLGFLKKNMNPSSYSDQYQCEGHYLILNCTRMLQTSTCGAGGYGVLLAEFNAPDSGSCNKTSIRLCVLQRQRMSIKVNVTEPARIDVTTAAPVITTKPLNRTSRNAGARTGHTENATAILLISTAFLLMCLVSSNH